MNFRLVFTASEDAPLSDRLLSFAALHVADARAVGNVLGALSWLPLPFFVSHVKRVKKDAEGGGACVLLCEVTRIGEELGVSSMDEDLDLCSPSHARFARAVAAAGTNRLLSVSVVAVPPSDRVTSDVESCAVWPMVFAPRALAVAAAARVAAARAPAGVARYFAAGLRAADAAAARGGVSSGVAFSVETAEMGTTLELRADGAAARDGHPFQTAVLSAIADLAAKDRAAKGGGGVGVNSASRGRARDAGCCCCWRWR